MDDEEWADAARRISVTFCGWGMEITGELIG
jgi:hypothetical protein